MTRQVELAVVGAGPAGLAAAIEAAELGLEVLVLDEQPAPGGQIYRNVEAVAETRTEDLALLGRDYAAGLDLVRRFREAGVAYQPLSAVFEVREGGRLGVLREGRAEALRAGEVLIAAGAMERPVPIRGWTLPGVIGAGAAQTLLKASNVVPDGATVIAGSGPLVLLVAVQLAQAGVQIRALLRTTPKRQYRAALRYLPAVAFERQLWQGLAWLAELRRLGVKLIDGVTMLAAEGEGRLEAVRYARGGETARLEADNLLLHEGVMPNLQLSRVAGCRHQWDPLARCWRPEIDTFGATSLPGLTLAGDCAGIGGALAAASQGRLAAIGAAARLGRIDTRERDRRAAPVQAELSRHLKLRPFLETLFRPADEMVVPVNESTIVCRCEEIDAGELRRLAALGVPGPNQAKSFSRVGMGPCQGRMCGPIVSEILAQATGRPMAEIGHYRIRPPVKPLTVGELAGIEGLDGGARAVVPGDREPAQK